MLLFHMRSWSPLLAILTFTRFSKASKPISVALQAAFDAPPLLVELLETAAAENATSLVPLLDDIASGTFHATASDKDLYSKFVSILVRNGHLRDETALSSWKFALSVHEAAPKIEAHYRLWESAVQGAFISSAGQMDPGFDIFRPDGERCRHPVCDTGVELSDAGGKAHLDPKAFDRVAGTLESSGWVIYLDPTDPSGVAGYSAWRETHPGTPFRLRYRPPNELSSYIATKKPLIVSGYGVELALKRTDYIVIDDRDAVKDDSTAPSPGGPEGDSIKDVKPLTSSELSDIGLKAASFVMDSHQRLATLLELSQDFPKFAASLAAVNISQNFALEHRTNREILLPSGQNSMWINRLQINARDVNAYTLIDTLRRERKFVQALQQLGLSASESIDLLAHPEVAQGSSSGDVQRYDFSDELEGGSVILWLNDLEKDKRYAEWPDDLRVLPAVRRDIHNVIVPVDLSDQGATRLVVETLRNIIKRLVPIRFGIIPTINSESAINQAKVSAYLQETFGLAALFDYLELATLKTALIQPSQGVLDTISSGRAPRRNQTPLSLDDILGSEKYDAKVTQSLKYIQRLGLDGQSPPIIANGAILPFGDDWMQILGQRVSTDLRTVQNQVYENLLTDHTWIPSIFLASASSIRNPIIVPEDEASVKVIDMSLVMPAHSPERFHYQSLNPGEADQPQMFVFIDPSVEKGLELLVNTVDFALAHQAVNVITVLSSQNEAGWETEARNFLNHRRSDWSLSAIDTILQSLRPDHKSSFLKQICGLNPGQQGILINGRMVGPFSNTTAFGAEDFVPLVTYEQKKRINPALEALKSSNLSHILKSPSDLAIVTSILSLASSPDPSHGNFDAMTTPRGSAFSNWKEEHTCIHFGQSDAVVEVVVSLDPISEVGQSWVPILQILGRMDGIRAKIYLNPKERLQELPVKRFYRQVLEAEPNFDDAGILVPPKAQFLGIPEETLLTLALDTPPSWLVAPRASVQDLDNIKLASIKQQNGIDALYELEHILIEGHSRDSTTGTAPRGVQLTLSTEREHNLAGTIIMANLGYFQFKANPGVYTLALQRGRSEIVYNLDSAGTGSQATQNINTEIALASFKGATIFPRLSKKPGKEGEDVLDVPRTSAENTVGWVAKQSQSLTRSGAQYLDKLLAAVGFATPDSAALMRQGTSTVAAFLSQIGLPTPTSTEGRTLNVKHADINIFSVASGHLYERMLSIMMVSVVRHTDHSVKFWFIEQFLSPSFKEFLPILATEYGFAYEMITYKWPHWLRAQKEKQRVIWGYKILFLDVLFPLDLDKVIFVDADQIVRTDMFDLVTHDLNGAPYGFTPMCDSRVEMEGFRFWKQGYWKSFLKGLPYHISALYVVDLKLFRAMAAGDRLRQQYHTLSADPNSLSNLDQDLPNHMQMMLPIHSLPQEWLWCETWCDDESLKTARTIDLCNNPMTKEPKLDRAKRQVPEWTMYDDEIAALAKRNAGAQPPPPHIDAAGGASHALPRDKQEL